MFYKICFLQEIRSSHLYNLKKPSKTEKNTGKSYKICWNQVNYLEFRLFKFSKLKYRKGDSNNLLQNLLSSRNQVPNFNLKKFWNTGRCKNQEQQEAKSCKIHWNLINKINDARFDSEEATRCLAFFFLWFILLHHKRLFDSYNLCCWTHANNVITVSNDIVILVWYMLVFLWYVFIIDHNRPPRNIPLLS